jgi:hypothetical protein
MNRYNLLIVAAWLAAPTLARGAETLQSYAQKCDLAVGMTVPDFSCDNGTLVPDTHPMGSACDRPNQLNQACDPGSRFQMLVDNDKAAIVAHCRKMGNSAGKYGDIAVIQHNRKNGATCYYQALKSFVNRELDGNVSAPSQGVGTPKFWLEPSEIAGSGFPCGGCHDNGPIVRSPYLTQLVTKPNVLPGAGDDTFNSDPEKYYFVGAEFANWKAFRVEVPGNKCNDCHRLGVNNLLPAGGTARDFAIRATGRAQTNKNPASAQSPLWMLKDQAAYSQENSDAAAAIKACADKFTAGAALPNQPDCKITQLTGPAPGPTLRMGGQLASDPAVAANADGRLEVFVRGSDSALYHMWQTDLDGSWSDFASLAGEVAGNSAVGRNADGRLEVFVRAPDSTLRHIWQDPTTGWSDWRSMGGELTTDPAVASNADGRLEAFARGTDNALWHTWQTSPNGDWSGWQTLAGTLVSAPVVAANADGRLEVFVRGTDGALWHNWQTSPNGDWSGWATMGGQLTSDPVLGSNADGRLEVFARGPDSALWHAWQTAPNSDWSAWDSLAGVLAGSHAVGRNASGGLEVFAQGGDAAVWHRTQSGSEWSDWEQFGGELTNNIVVGRNADGRLEIFVRGSDDALWHNWLMPGWN